MTDHFWSLKKRLAWHWQMTLLSLTGERSQIQFSALQKHVLVHGRHQNMMMKWLPCHFDAKGSLFSFIDSYLESEIDPRGQTYYSRPSWSAICPFAGKLKDLAKLARWKKLILSIKRSEFRPINRAENSERFRPLSCTLPICIKVPFSHFSSHHQRLAVLVATPCLSHTLKMWACLTVYYII